MVSGVVMTSGAEGESVGAAVGFTVDLVLREVLAGDVVEVVVSVAGASPERAVVFEMSSLVAAADLRLVLALDEVLVVEEVADVASSVKGTS